MHKKHSLNSWHTPAACSTIRLPQAKKTCGVNSAGDIVKLKHVKTDSEKSRAAVRQAKKIKTIQEQYSGTGYSQYLNAFVGDKKK